MPTSSRELFRVRLNGDSVHNEREINAVLGRLADYFDQITGGRGTPKFLGDVNAGQHRVTNLGDPRHDDDAIKKSLALTRKSKSTNWDARGRTIEGIPIAVTAGEAVPLEQVDRLIRSTLQAIDATVAPPKVANASDIGSQNAKFAREQHTHQGLNLDDPQIITGAKTFDLDPAAPFIVTAGSAVVANLDADRVDGRDESAFALLAGRAGSQTLTGGTGASESLSLRSTSHATKGALNIGESGGTLGFFGVAAVARAAAYTITNALTDRSYNADLTSLDEIADVLATLIADLRAYGLVQ